MTKIPLKNDINNIIAKILSKEADVEEIIAFSEWINESPENKEEIEVLTEFWESHTEEESLSTEIYFCQDESHLFGGSSSVPGSMKDGRNKRFLLLSIAASLLILFMVGSVMFFKGAGLGDGSTAENYVLLSQDNIGHYILPDSSKVTLNKNSRLVYTNKFLDENRVVELEGEAYFEVTKKDSKKFIVKVGDSQIEVLGTKFDVNARNAEDRIVTTLVEGSVVFRNKNQELLMHPNQQLTFHTHSGEMETVGIDAYLNTEWKDNIYRCNSIQIQDLMRQLAEYYGMEIDVDKRYQGIRVSGAFHKDQSLEKTLKIMQESIGFRWRISNDKVIIY